MTIVLVATDGSELSVHAARRAFELLGPSTEVTVLAVLADAPGADAGGFESSTATPAEQTREWQSEVGEVQDAISETLAEVHGAKVIKRVESGDAGPMVVWVAEQIGADVIVVGSHGKSALKRMVIGSVSEHIVRHAPCTVLVVRKGTD